MVVNQNIKVVSLFDGISVAQLALKELGYMPEYWASEIAYEAIKATQVNHPKTKHIGDITTVTPDHLPLNFDLLIGGSPCQDLSIAKGKREGLAGARSGLFYEYVKILRRHEPKYFVLENVASMSEENKQAITEQLGVEPIMIDAALVSAQSRKRLFWTNIPNVTLPIDQGVVIKDILQNDAERQYLTPINPIKTSRGLKWDTSGKGYFSQQDRAYSVNGKFPTVPTARTITKANIVLENGQIARLTFNELERLQSLPDDYTAPIKTKEKRGGAIGNAFNKEVIKHILSFMN